MQTPPPDLNLLTDTAPEELNRQSRDYFEADRIGLELELLREELANLKQGRTQRSLYGVFLPFLVVCWLVMVAVVLFLSGFSVSSFQLSDLVLTALIGTATASLIGIFAIVVRDLFPGR